VRTGRHEVASTRFASRSLLGSARATRLRFASLLALLSTPL
jgi:hypothetical protein